MMDFSFQLLNDKYSYDLGHCLHKTHPCIETVRESFQKQGLAYFSICITDFQSSCLPIPDIVSARPLT